MKILSLFLCVALLLCLLTACAAQPADPQGTSAQSTVSPVPAVNTTAANTTAKPNVQPTLEDVVDLFDASRFTIQSYGNDMIAYIADQLSLDGEILAVVHIIRPVDGAENEWAYVYEFSDEDDAKGFEENRSIFVAGLENGVCVRFGTVVVYGNAEQISTLK